MEYHAFASLAHFRILLVPVGSISRSTFDNWASEIRTLETIRLSDIPPGTKDEKARFMPSPKSKGHLHLSFPSHPPPISHASMSLFRPSHFPLGVIGIASCSHTDSLSSISAEFNAAMTDLFPVQSIFPLAKNCFVFEEGDGTTHLNLGDHLPGLVIIPSMMGNKKENIETLLADLCSNILAEFSTVLQTLESPLGNEYLNASLFPFLPSSSDLPLPMVDDEPESTTPLPSYNSQPELSGAPRRGSAPMLALKRNSSTGPGTITSVPRRTTLGVANARKRQSGIGAASSHGRLFKVLGDFFILAGRTEDAAVWYTEAIALFKTAADNVWHASALEGLATVAVLEAWSSGQGLQASMSNSKEPWSEVSDRLEQAVTLYSRTNPTSDPDHRYDLLAYLYTVAILRHSSLLFATWSSKGWGPLAFSALLHPGPTPYLPPTLMHADSHLLINRDRLSTISGVSRTQISAVLSQAHGPWLLHLGHRERIVILEAMASMYSSIGYHRREAYILREVVGCVMDLVVCGRDEAASANSVGLAITFTGSEGQTQLGGKGAVGIKATEKADGNESILRLVKYICNVHGVDLDTVKLIDFALQRDSVDGETENSIMQRGDPEDILEDPYGWPELQIGIVREAIAVAEALPVDPPAVAQFSLSALKCLHGVFSEDDQYYMYATASRALTDARRRGDTRSVDYWSGQPVVSIELLPLPSGRLVIENPVSILAQRLSREVGVLPRLDPFLYNPRKALTAQGRSLVVKDELLEFVVTLRNPYVFNLDIQSVSLSTSGVRFEAKSISLSIPANSYHSITMVGTPKESGMLVIRGCFVQAPGGVSCEFLLPVSTTEEEDRKSRRRSAIACESGRSKYGGLESRPWGKDGKRISTVGGTVPNLPTPKFLECKVVPEQPLLRIRWSSLTHGAVMLYDGEKSTLRLTLENVSSLPIDFLRLTFDDSTIGPAQTALAEGDLSVYDAYETEYELINRPVFSWSRDQENTEILPGRKVVVVVTCMGKVGCTSGGIYMSYSHVHRRQSSLQEPSDIFHTRQLSYPVLVTVYHMLECHGMDILPFEAEEYLDIARSNDEHGQASGNSIRPLLRDVEEDGWCLFSIDVRNTYGLPFEVTFERVQKDSPSASTTRMVAPGSMTRILLPIKKMLLAEEIASQAIPTLSDRQFVVNKSSLTSAEEKAQRELFWYREELFKCIRGRWREAGGTRSGELSLRQQRLTLPMLETLRTETARVHMALYHRSDDEASPWQNVDRRDGKYLPKPYEYAYLRTRVTNLSLGPLLLSLDLSMDPSDHVIQEGILSDIPLGRLGHGETQEVETPLCFVSCGRFEMHADVRILGTRHEEGKVGFGILKAVVDDD
ncbi:hypothetical protein BV25DRAFT_1945461 [Artomyces pyxidatus]|uniref:Uncharacterized protein n=1 Tax=Artomyces pyxidatus TaxID=48021 RepID=A0ACB8T1C4_9AGAM|nr:hypothetical protein BV25DRAFT_1945461 [Artomyces pyxidatus]